MNPINKEKISKSRGVWKELIVNNKTYFTMVTFHPAYLLRQPDQKKFSWADLKEIKNTLNYGRFNGMTICPVCLK